MWMVGGECLFECDFFCDVGVCVVFVKSPYKSHDPIPLGRVQFIHR